MKNLDWMGTVVFPQLTCFSGSNVHQLLSDVTWLATGSTPSQIHSSSGETVETMLQFLGSRIGDGKIPRM